MTGKTIVFCIFCKFPIRMAHNKRDGQAAGCDADENVLQIYRK